MICLDGKRGNFTVNSTMPFDDVSLLDVFSEEEEEGEYYWGVSTDL